MYATRMISRGLLDITLWPEASLIYVSFIDKCRAYYSFDAAILRRLRFIEMLNAPSASHERHLLPADDAA